MADDVDFDKLLSDIGAPPNATMSLHFLSRARAGAGNIVESPRGSNPNRMPKPKTPQKAAGAAANASAAAKASSSVAASSAAVVPHPPAPARTAASNNNNSDLDDILAVHTTHSPTNQPTYPPTTIPSP